MTCRRGRLDREQGSPSKPGRPQDSKDFESELSQAALVLSETLLSQGMVQPNQVGGGETDIARAGSFGTLSAGTGINRFLQGHVQADIPRFRITSTIGTVCPSPGKGQETQRFICSSAAIPSALFDTCPSAFRKRRLCPRPVSGDRHLQNQSRPCLGCNGLGVNAAGAGGVYTFETGWSSLPFGSNSWWRSPRHPRYGR